MNIDLSKRVALVTGAPKGLGAEIARELARNGADIAITYLQDAASGASLGKEIEKMGRRCIALQADAADFHRAEQVVAEVVAKLGGIHILINNAGIACDAAIWGMTESQWNDIVNVTLKGSFNYLRWVAPHYMQQKYGKVVCIGSINGLRGRAGTTSYNAAKAGLVGLVKTAAAELGAYNINVNLIAPGFIETSTQINTPQSVRDRVLNECAIKRLGMPEDIATVVAFLVSEAARHVTGQVFKVDAGQYL